MKELSFIWEVHSQFGVQGQCYNPPKSRAEAGQRRALGGLQGREGPPMGLDPQEDSLDRGSPALPSSIPPTAGFFGFLWTLHAPGMCRGGQQVPPGGLSPCQPPRKSGNVAASAPRHIHIASHSFLLRASPCPSRPGSSITTLRMSTARMYQCEAPPAAPHTFGAGG